MPGKVFLNYRRADAEAWADRLFERLIQHFPRENVFLDIDGHIPFGFPWAHWLDSQVATCDLMLVLIGRSWATEFKMRSQPEERDYVRVEIESALKRNIPVVPVFLGDTPVPKAEELPETMRPLLDLQATRLHRNSFDIDAQTLVRGAARSIALARGETTSNSTLAANEGGEIKDTDYLKRGIARVDKRDYERDIEDLNKAIEINPKDANAYFYRGIAYGHKEDYDRAIADFNKGIEINPKDARVFRVRGAAYGRKGDYESAIADLSKAITIDPKDATNYNNRAWAYFKVGKTRQGLPDAERALQLNPNDAESLDTRGHIYEALGRREDAIADFRRALSINADIAESRDGLKRLGGAP